MSRPPDLPAPPSLAGLLAAGPVSLFLDFDGTLVRLADRPDAIEVPADLADRIEALAERLDGRLALISGRALDDLEGHIGALGVARAGSHGAARVRPDGKWWDDEPASVDDAVREAARAICRRDDLLFEDKAHGVAVHYRSAPDCRERLTAELRELAETHRLAVKSGRFVIEITRPDADKGAAVRAFMGRNPFAEGRPVFLGDDLTDEDGFSAVREAGGLAIVVGDRAPTVADHRLAGVDAVHEWLAL